MEQYKLSIIIWVRKYIELCKILKYKKSTIFSTKQTNSPFSLLKSNSIGFIKRNEHINYEQIISNQFIYEFFREMNVKAFLIEDLSEIKMLMVMKQMLKDKGYTNSQLFCILLSEYSKPISKLIIINLIILIGFLYKDDPDKDSMQNYSFKDYIFYLIFYSKEKNFENSLLLQTLWLISLGLDVFTDDSLVNNQVTDNILQIKENCSIKKKNSVLMTFLTSVQLNNNENETSASSSKRRIDEVTCIKDKLNNELNSLHEFRKDHKITKVIISTLNNKIKKFEPQKLVQKIENVQEDHKKINPKIFDSKEKSFRLNDESDSAKKSVLKYEDALEEISKLKEINQTQAKIIKDYEMKSEHNKNITIKSPVEKEKKQDEDELKEIHIETERRKSTLMDDLVDTYSQQNRFSLISNEQNDDFISEFSQVIIGLRKSKLLSLKNFSPFSVKNLLNNNENMNKPSLKTFNQIDFSISSDKGIEEKLLFNSRRSNRENLKDFSNLLERKETPRNLTYLKCKNILKSLKDKSLKQINLMHSCNKKTNSISLIQALNSKKKIIQEFDDPTFNLPDKNNNKNKNLNCISFSENRFEDKENIQNLYSKLNYYISLVEKNQTFENNDEMNNKNQLRGDKFIKESQNTKLINNQIENIHDFDKNLPYFKFRCVKKSPKNSFVSVYVLLPFICTLIVLFYESLQNFI